MRNAALSWRWKPQLARHTTKARRKRGASERHSVLSYRTRRQQLARRGANDQQARLLRLIPSDSERRYACAALHVALVWRWRFQLARHTTGAHHTREPPAGAVPYRRLRTVYNQRRMACARSKLECCAPPSDSERRRTSFARETRRCLGVGGRSLHVAPRARDKGERPLVGAGVFRKAQADHDQSGTARSLSVLELCPSFQRERAQAHQRRARNAALSWRWRPQLARRTTSA